MPPPRPPPVAICQSRSDWEPLLPTLKRHFRSFVPSLKRRVAATSSLPGGGEVHAGGGGGVGSVLGGATTAGDGGGGGGSAASAAGGGGGGVAVGGGGAAAGGAAGGASVGGMGVGGAGLGSGAAGAVALGQNSSAAHGNLLEAINLAIDVLENSHEEIVRSCRRLDPSPTRRPPVAQRLDPTLSPPPPRPPLPRALPATISHPSRAGSSGSRLLSDRLPVPLPPVPVRCLLRLRRTSPRRASRSCASRRARAGLRSTTSSPRSPSSG